MYGERSTRVVAFRGLSVHTNLEAVAIMLSTAFLGTTWLERALYPASFAFATGLHLGCHLLVAVLFGKGIDRMVLTRAGRIDYSGAAPGFVEALVRTAAGPSINGLSALVGTLILANADTASWNAYVLLAVQIFTFSSLVLTVINFLPAVPLDGGLILRVLLTRAIGDRAVKASVIVSAAVMLVMAVFGVIWFQPVLIYLAVVITYDNWRAQQRSPSAVVNFM